VFQDATRPESHLTVKKIFLSGIKDEIQTEDLQEYFSKFGEVKDVDIIVEKETGRKRGFAFITFDDYDPVDKVVCKYAYWSCVSRDKFCAIRRRFHIKFHIKLPVT